MTSLSNTILYKKLGSHSRDPNNRPRKTDLSKAISVTGENKLLLPAINSRDKIGDNGAANHKKSIILNTKKIAKSRERLTIESNFVGTDKTPRKKPFRPGYGMVLEGKKLAM
jgi:hypothetical protein